MASLRLEISDAPRAEDVEVMGQGLAAYNQDFVPAIMRSPLAVFLRDDCDAILGGVEALLYWRTAYINRVWVAPSHRGAGAGRRLMRAFEAEAVSRNIALAWLETMDWQALGFYEKLGFAQFASLEHPEPAPGIGARRSIFLRKDIG